MLRMDIQLKLLKQYDIKLETALKNIMLRLLCLSVNVAVVTVY